MLNVFHMSLGPVYVLLGEVSVQVLCPFFNWIVCLPGVELCEETFIQTGRRGAYGQPGGQDSQQGGSWRTGVGEAVAGGAGSPTFACR